MNPDLRQIQRDAAIAKLISEVRSLQKQVLGQVQSVKADAQTVVAERRRVLSLPKGDKGDKGDRGPAGINGRDGKDGAPGKDGLTPTKGKDYNTKEDQEAFLMKILARIRTPKDGQDAVIDEEKIIDEIINRIQKDKKLKTSDIAGLNEEIASYRNQLARKQAGQHGGGDTVVAGTNITIDTNANGTKTINSTGGVSLETDGTPNGDQSLLNLEAGTNITLTDNGTGTVTIDATGGGTFLGCRLYKSSGQAGVSTTLTALTFDSESYDTDTMHDNSTNNTRITFTTAGKYSVYGTGTTDGNAIARLGIRLNGTTYLAQIGVGNAGASTQNGCIIATDYEFAANDYVELMCAFGSSQTTTSGVAGCQFGAYKID